MDEMFLNTPAPARARWRVRKTTQRAAAWYFALALVTAGALYGGLKLRYLAYARTEAFRFHGDIDNGWGQGSAIYKTAAPRGTPVTLRLFLNSFLRRYDQLGVERVQGDYGLDYPPARLLIMSSWVWHVRHGLPDRRRPAQDISNVETAAPLLRLNSTMEALAAVAGFLLIRRVVTRTGQGVRKAELLGLVGAMLIWFNLPILIDGHVWPQWDNWILPFYLTAAWLGLRSNWLWCGACLGVGIMFKGQLLIVAPVFLFWPLFAGRWLAALDVAVGFFLGAMLFVSPWMLGSGRAILLYLLFLLIAGVGLYFMPRRYRLRTGLGSLSLGIFFAGLWFGSINWFLVGFAYGTHHWMSLTNGAIPNLAAVLGNEFGYGLNDVLFKIGRPFNTDMTTRGLLISLYALALPLCGLALALQDRRSNPRLLLAIALPWLAMGALLPQLHERYLIWAGATTALAVGVSFGATLLHLLIALLAATPIATALLASRNNGLLAPAAQHTAERWKYVLDHSWPSDSWALLLLMLVMGYLSLAPGARRETEPRTPLVAEPL